MLYIFPFCKRLQNGKGEAEGGKVKTQFTTVLVLTIAVTVMWSAWAGRKSPVTDAGGNVTLREDFNDLSGWTPLEFPKIKRHSQYRIRRMDGASVLEASSNASASGLVWKKRFNIYEHPVIRWRWMVTGVYEKGDATSKGGDDYPVRIYLVFEYDPARAGFFQKMKYRAARLFYGKYPPDSTLNYIWANRPHKGRFITSAYTNRARLVVLEQGMAKAGRWVDEEVNVLSDFRAAFGRMPPGTASIAIMNDSDNTGEHSVSYIDFIEVGGREEKK